MFTLPDTDTDTERIGLYCYVKNSGPTLIPMHVLILTQMGTAPNLVPILLPKRWNLIHSQCYFVLVSLRYLPIIGICIGIGLRIGLGQCKHIITETETDAMATIPNGIGVSVQYEHIHTNKSYLSVSVSVPVSVNAPLAILQTQTLNVSEWTMNVSEWTLNVNE